MQVHARLGFDTALSPDDVIGALTDFSAERPKTWPTLDPAKYHVFELGETCAVVREGNAFPDIWVRERYDWSRPGFVSWRTEDSNAFAVGSGFDVSVTPGPGGGAHVEIEGRRIAGTPIGFVVVLFLKLFGRTYLLGAYKKDFDRLAREGWDAGRRRR